MLIPEWESVASEIANAAKFVIISFVLLDFPLISFELKEVIMSAIRKYSLIDINYNPIIQIARDTR